MGQFVADHHWLTVVQLPDYAPELNPTEGVWSHVKRRLGNLAACGIDQLAAIVRTRFKSIQYRPGLIDAVITETGLVIQPNLHDHPDLSASVRNRQHSPNASGLSCQVSRDATDGDPLGGVVEAERA
jgi:putative transposase